ncbi:MAG: hypothetical protein ABIY50_11280, partial [Ignavibacteria bacterium]
MRKRISKKMKVVYILIFLLALLSYKFVDVWSLKSNEAVKTDQQSEILRGKIPYPLAYSVFVPASAYILQKILKPLAGKQARSFIYSYNLIIFIAFLLVYIVLYFFLRMFFSEITSITGLFLFLTIVPLSLNGVWPEIEVINFLYYILGFLCMFKSKDIFLPLIFAAGMLNDFSIIFLIVFYIVYKATQQKLLTKKSFTVVLLSVISIIIVFTALTWKFGFQGENIIRISENFDNIYSIFELWFTETIVFIVLSIMA